MGVPDLNLGRLSCVPLPAPEKGHPPSLPGPAPACPLRAGLCFCRCWPGGERGALQAFLGPPGPGWRRHLPYLLLSCPQPALHRGLRLWPGPSGPGGSCQKSQLRCQGSWGWGYTHLETGRPWLASWQLLAAGGGTASASCLAPPQGPLFPALHPHPKEAPGEPQGRLEKDTEPGISQTCRCLASMPQFPHQGNGLLTTS